MPFLVVQERKRQVQVQGGSQYAGVIPQLWLPIAISCITVIPQEFYTCPGFILCSRVYSSTGLYISITRHAVNEAAPFNISVTIAAICYGSSTSMAHIAVSFSNEAVSVRGQSLSGESCAPKDGIGIIEGAIDSICPTNPNPDWNAV